MKFTPFVDASFSKEHSYVNLFNCISFDVKIGDDACEQAKKDPCYKEGVSFHLKDECPCMDNLDEKFPDEKDPSP